MDAKLFEGKPSIRRTQSKIIQKNIEGTIILIYKNSRNNNNNF